jgi:hypothetical protein
MKMLRLLTPVWFAAVLLGQPAKDSTNPQAPADVDLALRARVTEFLNYHIRGEFRKAEALVAEDTKDDFYNRDKPRYMSCKGISDIRYSDHFTKAYVTVLCTVPMMIQPGNNEQQSDGPPQVPMGPPTVPIPGTWKLENGKWCWYIDKDLDRRTPFGILPPAPVGQGMAPGSVLPMVNGLDGTSPSSPADAAGIRAAIQAVHIPATAASLGAVPVEALHHVKLETGEISLKAGASARIKISNDAGDSRLLMVLGQVSGIEAKVESTNLKGGESTYLNLKAAEEAKSGTLNVVVITTGEMLPIQIEVK